MEDSGVQLHVRFTTRLPDTYRVSTDVMTVPGTIERRGLSKLINQLLKFEYPKPFDFAVEGHLLRSPLHQHCARIMCSVESEIEIEYLPVLLPPKEEKQAVQDDWIASVDGRGKEVLTASYDGCIKGWTDDLACQWSIAAHTHVVSDVTWVPGSKMFISASYDATLKAWTSPEVHNTPKTLAILQGHSKAVCKVAVSPDTHRCCSVGWDATVNIWPCGEALIEAKDNPQHRSKKQKTEKGPSDQPTISPVSKLTGHKGCVSDVVWPRKHTFYTAGWDHVIRKWDATTGVEIDSCETSRVVHCLASPPDGSPVVAFGSADAALRLWDSRITNEQSTVRRLGGGKKWIVSVSWSPFSDYHIVHGSYDGTVQVWDIRGDIPLMTQSVHNGKCLTVDWYKEWSIVSGGESKLLHRLDLSPSLP